MVRGPSLSLMDRLRIVLLAAGLAGLIANVACAAETFPMPGTSGWTVWHAEQARQEGSWEASLPSGNGTRYLQPKASEAALLFPIETDRETTLRIRPIWWPTGEQKLAHRFPYPLARQAGPDALDHIGRTVFATAPAAGRVIAINAASGKVLGLVEVGGYLADLVADRQAGKLYVADALGGRVVEIDAATRQVARAFPVAGGPWSLALNQGVLYVACREGKRVVALDAASGKLVREVALASAPINLELTGNPPTGLLVRFLQQPFDVFTLAPAPAEEQQFGIRQSGEVKPHQLTVDTGKGRQTIDVSKVTAGPANAATVHRFGGNPGPASVTAVTLGDPPAHMVFFLSPDRGRLGIYNQDSRSLDFIEVGGYLSGLALHNGKLYAADPAGDRLVVIDARSRKIESEVKITGEPWALVAVADVAWQRREPAWPPARINRLYVACRGTKDLAVVDPATRRVVKRVPLPAEPLAVGQVSMQSPDWNKLSLERIGLMLQPRVAVEFRPVTLSLANLEASPAPPGTLEAAPRRESVSVPMDEGAKTFSADDALVLGVDGKRWLDLSAYADPQRMADPALAAKEERGSITFAVDDGPEHNWAAGIWQSPDDGRFLVNESEKFWQYNAPRVQVGPGRHVIRVTAHSPYVRLEGVAVARCPEPQLEVAVTPEPQEVHGQVPLISYQGVFYDQEPVAFSLHLANHSAAAMPVQISQVLSNYMGETVESSGPLAIELAAGENWSQSLRFSPRDTGRFTLTVTVDSPDGQVMKEMRFLRLPKLEHPRLFLRQSDLPAIEARMARYPNLFRRYGDWIERMSRKEGRFPERFLPPGLSTTDCASAAPASITDPEKARDACAWRNYELGWRLLGTQFVANLMKPDSVTLSGKINDVLAHTSIDIDQYYFPDQFHYHGPLFPGVDAGLLDWAPDQVRDSVPLNAFMTSHLGEMDKLTWTLVTLEEPLTPQKRALFYAIMALEDNAEQYFTTHQGKHGGTWWMSPFTGCTCPTNCYTSFFVYLHNVFGEPRLFEKFLFAGYPTFMRYADPLHDNRGIQPDSEIQPHGEPWRWMMTSLSRLPLERSMYQWDEWVKNMEGPLPGDERAEVDKLMALDGMALRGPFAGGVSWFVTGVSVPVALALGWYEPEGPTVNLTEMPPTAVFDVEGWVPMRSGWDSKATEVTFISGTREHTNRHRPNHFTIVKGGEYLIGTPATVGDDGNSVGAWANSVVVDDQWEQQWGLNLHYPRDEEHLLINRFSPATWNYLARDARLFGYIAADEGYGGGLDLHGHTETPFLQEGQLVGYQTWPKLDYAAGDAANAWPVDLVSQIDRQLVFLKPDLVVIYDRVKIGSAGHKSKWIAATGPKLAVEGSDFLVHSNAAFLAGRVLLPETPVLATPPPAGMGWNWRDQKLLEVAPAQQTSQTEYLVVMRVGEGGAPLPATDLIHDDARAGVKLSLGNRQIEIRFNRNGPVGGDAAVTENGVTDRYQLQDTLEDNYRKWQSDSRYRKWTDEPRFRFMFPRGR